MQSSPNAPNQKDETGNKLFQLGAGPAEALVEPEDQDFQGSDQNEDGGSAEVHAGILLIIEASLLFHCHGFGQIAGLVHITPAAHRDMVSQQLQGNHFQDWHQQLRR